LAGRGRELRAPVDDSGAVRLASVLRPVRPRALAPTGGQPSRPLPLGGNVDRAGRGRSFDAAAFLVRGAGRPGAAGRPRDDPVSGGPLPRGGTSGRGRPRPDSP